ncbi:MAG: hypothetical protein K0V04_02285 [Deltaproteobacteria bacterium]|nr:hypothetical protein [Deltaproteobacteria bacterium]
MRRELRRHAAWLPLVSPFAPGDYGFFESGVFRRIGNVRDFGISYRTQTGSEARLNFKTQRGVSVSFTVEGQGQVPELPAGQMGASIEYKLDKARSFMLKAPVIASESISDIAATGLALRDHLGGRWRRRYKLVTEVLTARDATVFGSNTSGSVITVRGKADALQRFHMAKTTADVELTWTGSLSLEVVGAEGPCGLALARFGRSGVPAFEAARATGGLAMLEPELVSDDDPDDDF